MTDDEAAASIALGNEIAKAIRRKSRANCDAALRHIIEHQSLHDAKMIAASILNLSYSDAGALCWRLKNSKPRDIVSPTWGM